MSVSGITATVLATGLAEAISNDELDEAAIAENLPSNSHAIKQIKYNLKPSIRGIV
jgi:hypothetical protein